MSLVLVFFVSQLMLRRNEERHLTAKQGKGKGQTKGNAKSTTDKNSPPKFEGECRHCGKGGHKWASCRKRLVESQDNKVHALDGAPSTCEGGSSGRHRGDR